MQALQCASAAVLQCCRALKNLLGLSQLPNLSRVLHKPQNYRTSGVFQLRKNCCGQEKHDKQGNAWLTIRTPLFVCLIFNVCIMCAGTYTCVLGLALTLALALAWHGFFMVCNSVAMRYNAI